MAAPESERRSRIRNRDHRITRASPLADLPPGEVHVWLTSTEDRQSNDRHGLRLAALSAAERERYRQLRAGPVRQDYLLAHVHLRTTLSRYAAVVPSAWAFRANRHGRPEIDYPHQRPALRFNLSHTTGLVACAVTRNPAVGVDVERCGRQVRAAQVARRFFSPAEAAEIASLPADRQAARFLELWTLKESYAKARGLGLALPFDRFSFEFDRGGRISVSFGPHLDDDPRRWQFALLHPTDDHVLAVSVQHAPGEEVTIRLRDGDAD